MIVCICNCLRESQIRKQRDAGVATTADEVFATYDCEPRCARCVPEIEQLLAAGRPAPAAAAGHPAPGPAPAYALADCA